MKKKFELNNVHLLNVLLQDWLFFGEDQEVSFQIRYAWQLTNHTDDRFPDMVGFYRTRKLVTVYSENVKPC